MAEPIVINAETREITVPESERSFGVAGEHNVARKHFRINGRIVDGNDLAVGFAWKVCTENSAKQPNELVFIKRFHRAPRGCMVLSSFPRISEVVWFFIAVWFYHISPTQNPPQSNSCGGFPYYFLISSLS